jgi:ABC-type multidrug transport system fused ATPase/permease subunit
MNWLRSIERASEVFASCTRIEAFLSLVDDSVDDDVNNIRAAETLNSDVTKDGNYELVSTAVVVDLSSATEVTSVVTAEPLIRLDPASYHHGSDPSSPVLRDIQLIVLRGEILIVVGPVGCGKSSLLSALLGEIAEVPDVVSKSDATGSRTMSPHTTIAYCAQRPWILASSVKANIALAGSKDRVEENFKRPQHVDSALYTLAVESSLIVDDLAQWPAYDDTEVGERGISISGGQKARISLARAVYSDADRMSCFDEQSTQSDLFYHLYSVSSGRPSLRGGRPCRQDALLPLHRGCTERQRQGRGVGDPPVAVPETRGQGAGAGQARSADVLRDVRGAFKTR